MGIQDDKAYVKRQFISLRESVELVSTLSGASQKEAVVWLKARSFLDDIILLVCCEYGITVMEYADKLSQDGYEVFDTREIAKSHFHEVLNMAYVSNQEPTGQELDLYGLPRKRFYCLLEFYNQPVPQEQELDALSYIPNEVNGCSIYMTFHLRDEIMLLERQLKEQKAENERLLEELDSLKKSESATKRSNELRISAVLFNMSDIALDKPFSSFEAVKTHADLKGLCFPCKDTYKNFTVSIKQQLEQDRKLVQSVRTKSKLKT